MSSSRRVRGVRSDRPARRSSGKTRYDDWPGGTAIAM